TVADGAMYHPQGRLELREHDEMLKLLHVAVLCNEAEINVVANGGTERYQLNGSSTEIALVELALAAGVSVNALRARHPQLKVSYRAEGRNYMATEHGAVGSDDRLIAVKGNPAEVLALCKEQATAHGQRVALDEVARRAILKANDEMGGEALRMLGFAYAT